MKLCLTFLFAKLFFGYFQASKKNLPTALELNWQTKETEALLAYSTFISNRLNNVEVQRTAI
jgi:hypothetical protein